MVISPPEGSYRGLPHSIQLHCMEKLSRKMRIHQFLLSLPLTPLVTMRPQVRRLKSLPPPPTLPVLATVISSKELRRREGTISTLALKSSRLTNLRHVLLAKPRKLLSGGIQRMESPTAMPAGFASRSTECAAPPAFISLAKTKGN